MRAQENRPGLIDACDRIFRELLKTPRFKASLRVLINSVDPSSAPQLVRTLMWEDAELFLDLLGILPDLGNALLLALREMLQQLGNFPPPILAGFVNQMIEGLDGAALGEALGKVISVGRQVAKVENASVRDSLSRLVRDVSDGLARAAIAGGAEAPETFHFPALLPWLGEKIESWSESPEFVEHVCKPLSEALRKAAGPPGKSPSS